MKRIIKRVGLVVFGIFLEYTSQVFGNTQGPTMVELALSYDDVLLVPQKSSVASRKNVSTKTRLTKNISLNMPIVSANMDTVTEAGMAIAVAQLGGIGIIHRFNTIEDQVHEVLRVKRYRNAVIQHPITVHQDATLDQALIIMGDHGITGLLVVDDNNKLTGILTSRDTRFVTSGNVRVSELMTPKNNLVVGSVGITSEEALQVFAKYKIEKLPIIYPDGSIAGLITSKDILKKQQYPYSSVDQKDRLMVGAAIGVNADALDRAKALVDAEVDVLVIDIAHGHSDLAITIVRELKKLFPSIDVIAGNVATAQGAHDLIQAGADAIKVGVGPGSICTTRIMTGSGYPQLSAIVRCAQEADKYNIPVIADGGIKVSGDITKAIAAGASTVMLGNLLAGTDESPGKPLVKNGKKYKVIRGMASYGAHLGRSDRNTGKKTDSEFVPEGVEALVLYKGSVHEIIPQLLGGFRSGMSYCGVSNSEDMRGKGQFVQITQAGVRESNAHDVQEIGK